ncbi:ParB/Srx family N-terminal domain-containing protein [Escherichia coli]|jgi:ParB-like chromosome segregation protein Spo0J|uniref:ParB/Srx family N-terminal domain-containing protein n=1 Tax=Escherichia coli TaxID=562 RepID=UPI000BB4855F|nr:ParB/Srx family N-terminal domain-containing protein [Escherichia coli]EBE5235464.1 nuclease [Salmonella enterica]ECV9960238.1 nuclease [Salmonella enterica subsp. enterica]EIJ5968260.1 ParB N-terminal domain-containing protein [Salmonella enterica subsp. enterica serovar Adelaide]EIZ2073085.1 ParB N-terminal domain-containing protein [Salmonella enterica subsp. enterica serovar Infantis]HBN3499034.1 ParB N-terminal domain-containing protein [Escherichia coli O25b:H4-ST131]
MALKIEYLPVGKLLRYAKNSRTHSDEQVEQLVNSIREFGFTNPVLIDEKNELIAGHGRLAAAEILEMDKVPAIRLSNLSEKQKKAYRIADNKLALNAGWDMQLLAEEVKELMDDDFDIDLLGFNDAELDEMLSDEQPQEEDDNSSPVVQIKYLSIDKERIPATDMEIALLLDVYRQYHDAHETHEGFVQYLANGCK